MTASILITCDHPTDPFSLCGRSETVATTDIATARAVVERYGWRRAPSVGHGGGDRCPNHSGATRPGRILGGPETFGGSKAADTQGSVDARVEAEDDQQGDDA